MAKKKKQSKTGIKRSKVASKNTIKKKPSVPFFDRDWRTTSWFLYAMRNLLALVIIGSLTYMIYQKDPGYKWVFNNLLLGNIKDIEQRKDYTFEVKHEAKRGFFARYLFFINKNSPEDAIILFPSDEVIDGAPEEQKLDHMKYKAHVMYFIYPRKAVYAHKEEDQKYMDKITHVAIVNGQGYENVPYDVPNKQQYTVVPINPNTAK